MIRRIEEKDIPVILDWYNYYIRTSLCTFETELLSLEEFSDRVHKITNDYPWIILEEEGEPVGYAYLSAFNTRISYRMTCDLAIYLNPEKRGKGYGETLMKAIIELARKDGYTKMTSLITQGNTPSEQLHEKAGFEKKFLFENCGFKTKWLGVSWYVKELNPLGEQAPEIRNVDPEE